MKTIIDEIATCAAEYEMSTGLKPTRIYMGRHEMLTLGKWAYENGYQDNNGTAAREGKERPEVMGLPIYEVNDDGPHMRCCAERPKSPAAGRRSGGLKSSATRPEKEK